MLLFASALVAGQSSFAQSGKCGANVTFSFNSSTHTLTISGTGDMYDYCYDGPWESFKVDVTTIIVEDGVTSIGETAFSDFDDLVGVTIAASVKRIGQQAFMSCDHLAGFNFVGESQLTTIGERAFEGRNVALTTFNIPSGVSFIGDGVFADCQALYFISVDAGNEYFKNDAYGVLYTKDGTKLLAYPGGRVDPEYTIPSTVTTIGKEAFYEYDNIERIIIEDGSALETIDDFAFAYCDNLTAINIPSSVSCIGNYAFDDTPWHENLVQDLADVDFITVGKVLYKVKDTFSGSFVVDDIIAGIAGNAFEDCEGLESVTIPASVTYIGENAFGGCIKLESVTFSGVTTINGINSGTFYRCESLTDFTIPASVKTIDTEAFAGCTSLTSIHIPANVKYIGQCAFEGCNQLEDVAFEAGSTIDSIDICAFSYCAITSINIPASVTYIGPSAFSGCEALASINVNENSTSYSSVNGLLLSKDEKTLLAYPAGKTPNEIIPASVTRIGESAFDGNGNITSIIIPEGVTAIDNYAFYGCTELETVNIPESVTSLGFCAFAECAQLANVNVFPALPPSLGENAFDEIYHDCHFNFHGYLYDADDDWHDYVINHFDYTIIHALTLGAGITATPAPVIANNNRGYYTENTEITLSGGNSVVPIGCDPNGYMGYTLNRNPFMSEVFDMPTEDVRVEAFWMPLESAGTGTEDDPYIIEYPCQLDMLALMVNRVDDYTDKYFKLGNDITYSYEGYGPTESNFTPIGTIEFDANAAIGGNELGGGGQPEPIIKSFNGTFDGNGKTISGIRLYTNGGRVNDMCQSIFNIVGSSGVVKNLTVEDTKITAPMGGGGIAGIVNGGLIENCISYADINVNKPFMGQGMGIAGGIADQTQGGRITDCVSYSTITVEDDAEYFGVIGGIVGGNAGYVENCHSYASINIGDNAESCEMIGGVVGENRTGYIDNCYSYASISIGNNAENCRGFGGISGASSEGCITDCFSSVTIEVGDNPANVALFGGIVGCISEDVVDGNIVVDVNLPDLDDVGAILGCYSSGLLMSNNYYSNCTVGVRSNNIGWFEGDYTQNDGAVQATILVDTEDAPTTLANGEKVVYRREFKQGVSSTVCLPVAIDAAQASAAGKFFTFAGVDMTDPDDWAVVMQEVAGNMVAGELEANTPYLFIPDADGPVMFVVEADGSSVAAGSAVDGNWTFAGTFDSIVWNAGNANLGKVYGFAAEKYEAPDGDGDSNPDYTINPGKFVMAGAGACIAPYRAYLTYNAPQNAPSRNGSRASQQLPGSMKVILLSSNGVETAVGRINTATGNVSIDAWYDMNGRQIEGAPSKGGMYIHGGKTIMINE